MRILVFGAGATGGYFGGRLLQAGVDTTGIEPGGWGKISAEDKKIRIVQGILTDTTFGHQFDFVSATDVIEHQAEPDQMDGDRLRRSQSRLKRPCAM